MNKLLTVRPLSKRYTPVVGDVVVGRVVEVADKRWRVDVNARQDAALPLSSVNLPGGQRRRTDEDSLQMRAFYQEGDLISAEVQKVGQDQSAQLNTRSTKYGKLCFGQMVTVPASLIRRQRNHFHTLEEIGVEMIIGVNGYIWLAPIPTPEEQEKRLLLLNDETLFNKEGESSWFPTTITDAVRESIARLRNCILVLARNKKQIFREAILELYNQSVENGQSVADLL